MSVGIESQGDEHAPGADGFDPYVEAVRRDTYPYYRWLLRRDPVHRGAQDLWYVARFADVRHVLRDAGFGKAAFAERRSEVLGPGPMSDIWTESHLRREPSRP